MDSNNKHRSVPITESITKIGGGYPDKLTLFQIPASKYWWVRYYTQNRVVKKSTKTTNKTEAISFAKKFYESILIREHNSLPIGNSASFERCAMDMLKEQEELIKRGERNNLFNVHDKQKLDKDLLPFFRGYKIKDISYKNINDYLNKISERKLRPATLKIHLVLIHKILMFALRENLIDRVPAFPKVKLQDSPRGWFNHDEYVQLRKVTQQVIDKKIRHRGHLIDDEMRFLVTFMVNTFLRPSDIKNLKHRHITVVKNDKKYLRIQPETSKTVNNPIVSMEDAIGIYNDLITFNTENNWGVEEDDYVFFPYWKNRDHAQVMMRGMFDTILKEAKMKLTQSNQPRTLYSLRHTAIMFRLTKGGDIDLLTLARNARTSVGMIERFYAKPLQGEMNVDKIQSMKKD